MSFKDQQIPVYDDFEDYDRMSDYNLSVDHCIDFCLAQFADKPDEYYIEKINAYLSFLLFVCKNTNSDILAMYEEGATLLHRKEQMILIGEEYLNEKIYDKIIYVDPFRNFLKSLPYEYTVTDIDKRYGF